MKKWKGYPYPLGATWMGNGVNFALYSQNATAVELCLFNSVRGEGECQRINLTEREDEVWHIFLPEVRPGQLYGYRVHGLWKPEFGARFNPFKVVIDPYARALAGEFEFESAMYGYELGHVEGDLKLSTQDNAAMIPKGVVIEGTFDWESDRPPKTSLEDTVIYETHVRGFSQLWPEIPEEIRGTYQAMGHPSTIQYLQSLGVTAVELLPIQEIADEPFLKERQLVNYWGYNTIGFFAPAARYGSSLTPGDQVREFKEMVKNLHRAGLEVILDVVYNHTGEGNHLGPTLSFRGIDNQSYYRLVANQPRYYQDYTGTGNTVNVPHPRVLQLLMDSLRYWVQEMHVDGFRFDLAPTLARESHAVSKLSTFFSVIHQDPIISQVKLIAEPWDIGEGGYQVGNFPVLWCEWNGRYRDEIRRYWQGGRLPMCEIAYRLMGSPDLYEASSKRPTASINFVTCHDGFTLHDQVSYEVKHNEINGEKNRDGSTHNFSWNCGVEGETLDEEINRLRRRQRRNLLLTLFLSQGVPMLCGGDEYGRTQGGNNNAYCQDNEISWMRWRLSAEEKQFQKFTAQLIQFRMAHPIFHRPKFFQSREVIGRDLKDMTWFRADASELIGVDWLATGLQQLGLLMVGHDLDIQNFEGEDIQDETFYILFNSGGKESPFILPGTGRVTWELIIDTQAEEGFVSAPASHGAGGQVKLSAHSAQLYKQLTGSDREARTTGKK